MTSLDRLIATIRSAKRPQRDVYLDLAVDGRLTGWRMVGDRVLGAMLADDWAREVCCALQPNHLGDLRQRVVLTELRNLQASGEAVEVFAISDAIAMRDLELGTHLADNVDPAYIGGLLCTRPYPNWHSLNAHLSYLLGAEADLRRLLELRQEMAA